MVTRKKQFIIILLISSLFALVVMYRYYTDWCGDYCTQDILYQHVYDPDKQILFQMQDCGALGYNRRIVLVEKGFLFDSVKEIDTSQIDTSVWKLVKIEVNELKLKYP